MISIFSFGRPDIADKLQQPKMVEPVDSLECGIIDGFEVAPQPIPVDYLGLVEAVDHFGQTVVVAVSDAAD
jgi:hypothetical protein